MIARILAEDPRRCDDVSEFLVLFQDSAALALTIPALALLGSASLVYRGVGALLDIRDEVVAAEVANITIATGLLAWLSILSAALIPLLIAR